jgi:hypothetical protein
MTLQAEIDFERELWGTASLRASYLITNPHFPPL